MRPAAPGALRGPPGMSPVSTLMDYLPVFLRVRGAAALVVGGGAVALRKALWLQKAGAQVTVVAPALHPELGERSAAGEFRHISDRFAPAQLDGMAVAVAATGERNVNAAVATAARERGVPVNVVDDAELSTFIFPAIIDRSPLVVAVSSAGHAPVLARRVREQIEALLPARLGALARFMGERRAQLRRALGAPARRVFWERLISGPLATRVLNGEE